MASILKVDTIQDQTGNNIINENANVITIGASGDTITIPSGASMSGFSSTGIDDNATSTAITIDSSQFVGIGQTTPLHKLEVKDGEFAVRQTDSSAAPSIKVINDVTLQAYLRGAGTTRTNPGTAQGMPQLVSLSGYDLFISTDGNNNIPFTTNRSEKMRLTSDGKLGIGTSSPSQNLEIRTTASDTGILVKSTGNTSNSFNFDANRTSAIGGIGAIRGLWNGNGVAGIYFNAGNDTTNKDDGIITFATRTSGTGANPPERMRIDTSGNVGIGTSSPDATLSVNGVASFGDGTESLPSITNFGDLNTGIYFPTADTIAFSTNGDETIRINANGLLSVNRGKSSNGGLHLLSKNPISVSTSATNISATSSYGSLAFVWGLSGGNIFHDLVSWSLSQVDVIASQTISGAPAGRTYSASSGVLRVAMASGTYNVYEADIRTELS